MNHTAIRSWRGAASTQIDRLAWTIQRSPLDWSDDLMRRLSGSRSARIPGTDLPGGAADGSVYGRVAVPVGC